MTTTVSEKPDINKIRVIHRVFRRELTALPGLVRRVPDGDESRAEIVGRHAQFVLAGLHIYHTGEDENLWPLLLERAKPSTELIETMQAQHVGVHTHVDRAQDLLDASRRRPSSSTRRSSSTSTRRNARSCRWRSSSSASRSGGASASTVVDSMSREELPIMFGAILEEADPSERAQMLALLPPPIRLLCARSAPASTGATSPRSAPADRMPSVCRVRP